MGHKNLYGNFWLLIALLTAICWASEKQYTSRRWRLKFESDPPKPILIKEPDGKQTLYWYVRYKVTNAMSREVPWMVNIKIVIDKTRPGVPESQVPGVFHQATIPEEADKEQYLNSLQTYYDVNLPIVRQEIMKQLNLYPALSKNEQMVMDVLELENPKSIFTMMKQIKLSYDEIESALLALISRNLVISQEAHGDPSFIKVTSKGAIFYQNGETFALRVGEAVYDWKLLSFDKKQVVMQKGDVVTSFYPGASLEYNYSKSEKTIATRDPFYTSGMEAKGFYLGRSTNKDRKFRFRHAVIPAKSTHHGVAIFHDISREMDFMAVVVTGLADPVVRRTGKIYVKNEALLIAYQRLGDEFYSYQDTISFLYQKQIVLSFKEIKQD